MERAATVLLITGVSLGRIAAFVLIAVAASPVIVGAPPAEQQRAAPGASVDLALTAARHGSKF